MESRPGLLAGVCVFSNVQRVEDTWTSPRRTIAHALLPGNAHAGGGGARGTRAFAYLATRGTRPFAYLPTAYLATPTHTQFPHGDTHPVAFDGEGPDTLPVPPPEACLEELMQQEREQRVSTSTCGGGDTEASLWACLHPQTEGPQTEGPQTEGPVTEGLTQDSACLEYDLPCHIPREIPVRCPTPTVHKGGGEWVEGEVEEAGEREGQGVGQATDEGEAPRGRDVSNARHVYLGSDGVGCGKSSVACRKSALASPVLHVALASPPASAQGSEPSAGSGRRAGACTSCMCVRRCDGGREGWCVWAWNLEQILPLHFENVIEELWVGARWSVGNCQSDSVRWLLLPPSFCDEEYLIHLQPNGALVNVSHIAKGWSAFFIKVSLSGPGMLSDTLASRAHVGTHTDDAQERDTRPDTRHLGAQDVGGKDGIGHSESHRTRHIHLHRAHIQRLSFTPQSKPHLFGSGDGGDEAGAHNMDMVVKVRLRPRFVEQRLQPHATAATAAFSAPHPTSCESAAQGAPAVVKGSGGADRYVTRYVTVKNTEGASSRDAQPHRASNERLFPVYLCVDVW